MEEIIIRHGEETSRCKAVNLVLDFLKKRPPYYFRDYGLKIKHLKKATIYTVVKKPLNSSSREYKS